MPETPTIYLTNEQLVRLAGLSCDALIGIQLHTDASDQTDVVYEFVHIESPSGSMNHGIIEPDGRHHDTT